MYKYYGKLINLLLTRTSTTCQKCLFSQTRLKIQNNKTSAIISCKRKQYNFYVNTIYDKNDDVMLASKGWHHRKSKDDYFIIHPIKNDIEDKPQVSFSQLGLNNDFVEFLKIQNINYPTKIQIDGIPAILSGKNCLIAAETGCGKTFTYLLPIIQNILELKSKIPDRGFNSPLGLVLLPSRELASQIGEIADYLAYEVGFKTKLIIGGRTKQKMMNPSFENVDLLVATLGAMSKLTTTGIYRMHHVHHLVMDEADTLLDDSFNEKLVHFMKRFQLQYGGFSKESISGTQLTLVSATIPTSLPNILGEIIPPESIVQITTDQLHYILMNVPQRFLRLSKSDKPGELLKIIKENVRKKNPTIIFSNRSVTCDWVSMFLNENGVNCLNLNADMHADIRKGIFAKFQNGEVNVLSSTDIGSRGLDTVRVKHVLNYDFPLYTADYIHRCGRTGRLGSSENCYITNFISGSQEVELVQKIELAVRKMEQLPNVNGNITQIIKNKIMKDLHKNIVKLL